jgi:hypothetical protein
MKYIINYTVYVFIFIIINLAYLIWEFKPYNINLLKFIEEINNIECNENQDDFLI